MPKETVHKQTIDMTASTLRISTKTVAIIVTEYKRIYASIARAQKAQKAKEQKAQKAKEQRAQKVKAKRSKVVSNDK